MSNNEYILNQYKGCLSGLAVGDVLGTPFEFWKKENVAQYLRDDKLVIKDFSYGDVGFPAGFYSDDTATMICLAESLIEKDFNIDDQFERYRQWYQNGHATPFKDRCYGIGQQTLKSLAKKIDLNKMDGTDVTAGGNGCLMRCAPIGLYYRGNYKDIKEKSLLSSYLTHNYNIAGWACVVLNSIISLVAEGTPRNNILPEIQSIFGNTLPNEIQDVLDINYISINNYEYPVSGYSVDTLRIAIWAWLTSKNYIDGITKVILLGNDTDTFAAVTGAIAGCYYGYDSIAREYAEKVINNDYIVNLAEKIYNKQNANNFNVPSL
ncbi:MAG: ADP-ribosylglycohydrolase family protein [Patescibacteria group bacterium]